MSNILTALASNYWLVFFIFPLLLGGIASLWAKHQLKKWSQISSGSYQLTGEQIASRFLASNNVNNVAIKVAGPDQDFYDPRTKTINLSPEVYYSDSVAAISVACHEAGHACQHAEGYGLFKLRSALVPVCNAVNHLWMLLVLIGLFFAISGLIYVGIISFSLTLLFQLVTLPVELNASNRAKAYIRTIATNEECNTGAKKVLRACANTYLVAVLISALQLVYLLLRARN